MLTWFEVLKFIMIIVVAPYVIYWLLKKLKLVVGLAVVLSLLAIPAFISGAAETERHVSSLEKLKDERNKCIANMYKQMYNSCR